MGETLALFEQHSSERALFLSLIIHLLLATLGFLFIKESTQDVTFKSLRVNFASPIPVDLPEPEILEFVPPVPEIKPKKKVESPIVSKLKEELAIPQEGGSEKKVEEEISYDSQLTSTSLDSNLVFTPNGDSGEASTLEHSDYEYDAPGMTWTNGSALRLSSPFEPSYDVPSRGFIMDQVLVDIVVMPNGRVQSVSIRKPSSGSADLDGQIRAHLLTLQFEPYSTGPQREGLITLNFISSETSY